MTVAKLAAGQSIASIATKTADSFAIVSISRWRLNYVKSGVWRNESDASKSGGSPL
jgi:ATP-dependent protease HslVU (ClpYQ) peptidase subunit